MQRRAGYEADDFLAAAVAAEERRGGTALVASGDRDTFQLASETTTILYPVRAGEMARIGPAEVRERYGVDPKQVPDFIALARRSVGQAARARPASARKAPPTCCSDTDRSKPRSKAGRFPAHAKQLRLFRAIATMDAKAPLPRVKDQKPDWARASALARDWQLNQLASRLAKLAESEPE